MTDGPTIAPRESIAREIVFIDGLMRSGKSANAAVVCSLARVEMYQAYPLFEDLAALYELGLVRRDVAIGLLQREADLHLSEMLIGRMVNFRYDDKSSVFKHHDPKMYFRRLFADEVEDVNERFKGVNPIFPIFTHDVLCHPSIIFESFPTARYVASRRHPVDVVFSWQRRNWGDRIGTDPRSTFLALDTPAGPVPLHAHGWEAEYAELRPMDRIIQSVDRLSRRMEDNYWNLPPDKRSCVLLVTFEWMLQDTEAYVDALCEHLGTTRSAQTDMILKRERLPGTLGRSEFERRLAIIEDEASDQAFRVLMELAERYEADTTKKLGIDAAVFERQ